VALWPNRNHGRHWTHKADDIATSRQAALFATLEALGGREWQGEAVAVRITFHPTTNRRYDLQNVYSAMKGYQDGIADALKVDDSHFNPVTLVRGDKQPAARVVVELEGINARND
jgi:hypothetical protein